MRLYLKILFYMGNLPCFSTLSAISVSCGLCLENTNIISEPRFHPPPSSFHFDSTVNDKSAWIWQTLQVVESPEVGAMLVLDITLFFISQAVIISVGASNQVSEVDDDIAPRSRITMFQMQKPILSSEAISATRDVPLLDKVAEWIMPGVPQNISIAAEASSE